ncbi:MAG TPA: response regulator, partial [Vicinamibacterales bacterium]|nr:response regulator [Vicinamibacterales bacterium]
MVLLVDDCREQRELYEFVLSDTLEIFGASRGDEALRIAKRRPLDGVVLDVMMPDLDGWEVCRQLKSDPDTSAIPVVMLTASDGNDVPARAIQCGADAVLAKPCSAPKLLATILASIDRVS